MDCVECFDPEMTIRLLIVVCKLSRALHGAALAFISVLDGRALALIAANRSDLLASVAPLEESNMAPARKER